jgi:uncharacterized protein YcnI
MTRTLLRRAAVVTLGAAAFVLAVAGPASAHVTVNPGTATKGGYTAVTFRVPNETDSASTTKLEVNLPTDTPIASVSLKPVTGWTAVPVKSKLPKPIKTDDGEVTEAITKITWTAAAGSEIKPGQYQEFGVSLGPLPDADQVVFKALQTYSDGNIVRWIDEPTAGAEPENPAPVLKLTAAGPEPAASSAPAAGPQAAADTGDSGGTSAWGVAGTILGVIALVLGLLAYRRAVQSNA